MKFSLEFFVFPFKYIFLGKYLYLFQNIFIQLYCLFNNLIFYFFHFFYFYIFLISERILFFLGHMLYNPFHLNFYFFFKLSSLSTSVLTSAFYIIIFANSSSLFCSVLLFFSISVNDESSTIFLLWYMHHPNIWPNTLCTQCPSNQPRGNLTWQMSN